jgi:hypothetical protein
LLQYFYNEKRAPEIIVVKLYYSDTQNAIYLISIQIEVESINGSTELNERTRCIHVQTFFPTIEGNRIFCRKI